ncbi:MAG: CPBP family intramembrane glutamic endopeptidase, partial [Cyanobacteria bacterium J06555_12]
SILLGAVLGGLAATYPEFFKQSFSQVILISNSAIMASLCLLLMAKMVGCNMYIRDLVGGLSFNRSFWLLVLVVPVLLFSVGSGQIYFYIVSQLSPDQAVQMMGGSIELPTSESPIWEVMLSAVTVAVIVPITEEFLFRGILLHRWATKMGVLPGVFASSIFFGVLHPNPVGLTVFGLITSLIYLKTNSLWLVTAFHAINNGTVVGLGLLSSPAAPHSPEAVLELLQTGLLVGSVLMLITIPVLLYAIKMLWPHQSVQLPYFVNHWKRTEARHFASDRG